MKKHTLEDILKIPGNRAVFKSLKALLRDRQASVFVGAGASAGLYPLWGDFIEQLADHAVAEGKASPSDAKRWKKDTKSTPQQKINNILRKLEDPLYRQFLQTTFAPKKGTDGRRYTKAHAALIQLPFKGYVTTNYDPSLDFARAELRPDTLSTGTPTWKDDDEIYSWRTGDVFKKDCPILWAHGHSQRPDTIVLNSSEYSQAYKPGIYRDTFKELWLREHLVFIGFGFNDPQFTFMVGEFLSDIATAKPTNRHIALLGLKTENGNIADYNAIEEHRANLEADYNVSVLFYPVSDKDHSTLDTLLNDLTNEFSKPKPLPAPDAPKKPQPIVKWVHETTNDEKFTGRDYEFSRLDRWVRDQTVKIVGICAVGGTGKTSLIGHWLKNTDGWSIREFNGLFAWSFYQNRNVDEFFSNLRTWAQKSFSFKPTRGSNNLRNDTIRLLNENRIIIILDGLEVLQEAFDSAHHGNFLGDGLREVLQSLCEAQDSLSLAVLTSRLTFGDLERYLGTTFHQMDLSGLTASAGSKLLADLKVRGHKEELMTISERLDGHPLALRIFADSIPLKHKGSTIDFLDQTFRISRLPTNAPLTRRISSLLKFYEKQFSITEVRLLSIVALFRSPVNEKTIIRLTKGIFGAKRKDPLPNDNELKITLKTLHARKILTEEAFNNDLGSSCHPILRDHFRTFLINDSSGAAKKTADLLSGQPSGAKLSSTDDLEPIILAIDLLLEANDFVSADRLYKGRLENGQVFKHIPSASEGFSCASKFVVTLQRRQQCEKQLTRRGLWTYLSEAGELAMLSGYFEGAVEYFKEAITIAQEINHAHGEWLGLMDSATLHTFLGRLRVADDLAERAILLDYQIANSHDRTASGLAWRCWVSMLIGNRNISIDLFEAANQILALNPHLTFETICSIKIRLAEFLSLTQDTQLAKKTARSMIKSCSEHALNGYLGWCHLILSNCAIILLDIKTAKIELKRAERPIRSGQLLFWLARLHITAGKIAILEKNSSSALHSATEALALAQPRSMRLLHVDALILRGRARIMEKKQDSAIRALDDAEEALQIALKSFYILGERDALALKSDAYIILNDTASSNSLKTQIEHITKKIHVLKSDLDFSKKAPETDVPEK
jgi:tetratricopeptide (TPR) repeat protein